MALLLLLLMFLFLQSCVAVVVGLVVFERLFLLQPLVAAYGIIAVAVISDGIIAVAVIVVVILRRSFKM